MEPNISSEKACQEKVGCLRNNWMQIETAAFLLCIIGHKINLFSTGSLTGQTSSICYSNVEQVHVYLAK